MKRTVSKATLGRLPMYLNYIRAQGDDRISASEMARVLKLGEVLVRKDLFCICDKGRPKIGYPRLELIGELEEILGQKKCTPVVLAGAGKLGSALMDYPGFDEFGLRIIAGFDSDPRKINPDHPKCPVLPIEEMTAFCRANDVHVGVITVPVGAAKAVCERMVSSGITAIWNFAHCRLSAPAEVAIQNMNLALSLAYLCLGGGKEGEE